MLNFGIGNVGAVRAMYRRLGYQAELIDTPRPLKVGDRLILPGIGAFDAGVRALEQGGWRSYLLDYAAAGVPMLGICLGMQLLCSHSDEGSSEGLGLIPAAVRRLQPGDAKVRIPHMGWNIVTPVRANPLLPTTGEEQRFYFTHSFAVFDAGEHVLAVTDHGERFASAIGRGNVLGVQFHPEKSHRFGKELLERFADWSPAA